jgi:hypothetical protein
MVVNVPWTDNNTTYSSATSSTAWLVKLWDDTVQTQTANAVSSTAWKTYAIQTNSAWQMLVNVPWTDTTYSGWNGINISNGSVAIDTSVVATKTDLGNNIQYVTQAEYDLLPSSKLTDWVNYFIYTPSQNNGGN